MEIIVNHNNNGNNGKYNLIRSAKTLVVIVAALGVAACSNGSSGSSSTPTNMYQANYAQALNIYNSMTEDERIGQIILPSYVLLNNSVESNNSNCMAAFTSNESAAIIAACGLDQIATYHIGAVLTGGGPFFSLAPTAANWKRLNELAVQVHNNSNTLDPILLTGNDAVHLNQHIQGAVISPHNIGLGATHDPELIVELETQSGLDSLYTGFNWVYAPTLAVVQDTRWGRSYEGFAADPALVKTIAESYISGAQNIQNNKITGALATAKHFIGDGATLYGFDESNDAYSGSETAFWDENGQGYEGANNANVGSLMTSYSAIDGPNTFMHFGGKWDIVNQFKESGIVGSDGATYQFPGFVVSDWNAPMRSAWFYSTEQNLSQLSLEQIMAKSINAGVDMVMVSSGSTVNPWDSSSDPQYNFTTLAQVVAATKAAVDDGSISQARLQDAVVRILAVKLAMVPASNIDYDQVQEQERQLALQAAEQSLILLKNNNNLLPINESNIRNVVFIGNVNDVGLQNGGWTINWQGQESNQYFTESDKISSGTATLEDGIRAALSGESVTYYYVTPDNLSILPTLESSNTLAIALVSESPYAEMMGDIGNSTVSDGWYDYGQLEGYNFYTPSPQSQFMGLTYTASESAAVAQLQGYRVPITTVVYSGRPVVISEDQNGLTSDAPLPNSDSVIAAFLPGTTGGTAIANAIFGTYRFKSAANGQSNTLTFPWPANMQQVITHFESSLYPVGYGLSD